jgi:formate hydrogenlyase transcriptional activator
MITLVAGETVSGQSDKGNPVSEAAALRAIAEGVEAETGARFFSSLVQHLATALGCQYSFVTELRRATGTFRTLAVWGRGEFLENFEIPLKGTPCEDVLAGKCAHYPEHIQQLFPEDVGIRVWNAESYCGVPILDTTGACVGHLAIFDDKPMYDGTRGINIMRIFAARVQAEIQRERSELALRESELRYRDLYENAPSPILSAAPDGRIVRWNRRFLEWSKCAPERMQSLMLSDFWPGALADQIELKEANRRWRSGERFEAEFQLRIGDGTNRWIRAAGRSILDPFGNVERSEIIIVDISDRKRAEQALRESEHRLSKVLDSAMDAIVTFDASRRIELFNRTAENVFECPALDAIGKSVDRFLGEGFGKALASSMRAASRGRQEHPYVFSAGGLAARRANGVEFPVEATISHVEVSGRSLFTLIIRDIDQRKRAENELLRLSLQNEYLQEEIKESHNVGEIVGASRALSAVLQKVRLVAGTDSSVLILGETGTGKELIARALHSGSQRKDRPLIKVNCAALPAGLIESELFGHERGAFTGATEKRIGRFELANGGTIFLDEIGEMPAEVQVKLLRVLQEREFERVGGDRTIKVDVRVIAATNRNLAREVAEGKFRQDLYYRLNVFPLQVPPLRERPEDIAPLVNFFMRRYANKIGRAISSIPEETMERLASYSWPGNVRELENVIERAVILSPGPELEISFEVLPVAMRQVAADRPPEERGPHAQRKLSSLSELERSHIVETLKRTSWRIDGPNGAARILNLNPSTLRSKIKKLGIRRSADGI